jgi:DNA-binding NarL/FixJ family response regulator
LREQRPAARILIADDHQLLADACKSMLEPEFSVVGSVTDGCDLADAVDALKPDIVLLDIYMPNLNGFDAGERVKKDHPKTKLIFLTMTLAADVAAEAFRRGASGYVLKQSAGTELLLAVRKVNKGESYLSPLVAREALAFLLNKAPLQKNPAITHRQSEILQLLAQGQSMKQIASVLGVQPGTVAFHKYQMMERLNLRSNAELLAYALKRHMGSSVGSVAAKNLIIS